MAACFAGINASQGSVATYTRCGGGMFNIYLLWKFTKKSSSEKNFASRLRFDIIMVMIL